jgi:TolB-like protein
MKDIVGALAKASASLGQWIANLGPYSWNEIAFVLALAIGAVLAVVFAFYIISRRNRAIEFVDQSEVVTSPLRNQAEPQFKPLGPKARSAGAEPVLIDAVPVVTKVAPRPAPQISQPPLIEPQQRPKATPIRAQLVLGPFDAGSGNISEIAHANAISQRLKIVLAALAPHIAVERNAEAFKSSEKLDRYTLTGAVRHMGDRIRLQVEMTDDKTGANLFRFRYQGLPNEQDVMLAEITSRVLKATTHSPEHKSDAA